MWAKGRSNAWVSYKQDRIAQIWSIYLVAEAQVEEAVGLVEHEDLDGVERDGRCVAKQVDQPARRRDDHVGR